MSGMRWRGEVKWKSYRETRRCLYPHELEQEVLDLGRGGAPRRKGALRGRNDALRAAALERLGIKSVDRF